MIMNYFYFYFLFIHTRLQPIWIMAAYILPSFSVRSPRGGGSLPAALLPRPGMSQERITRTKEITKEITFEDGVRPLPLLCRTP